MTREEYNNYRGWAMPADENGKDPGYKVRYKGGYESWSPKDVFEESYRPVNAMNFSHALQVLKDGHKVARSGWNGKDMFLFLVNGSKFKVNRPPLLGIYEEGTEIDYCAHIDMKMDDGRIMVWTPAPIDLLSEDWYIVS